MPRQSRSLGVSVPGQVEDVLAELFLIGAAVAEPAEEGDLITTHRMLPR